MPKLRSSLPNDWHIGDTLEVLVDQPEASKTDVCLFEIVDANKLRIRDAMFVPIQATKPLEEQLAGSDLAAQNEASWSRTMPGRAPVPPPPMPDRVFEEGEPTPTIRDFHGLVLDKITPGPDGESVVFNFTNGWKLIARSEYNPPSLSCQIKRRVVQEKTEDVRLEP